MICQRPQNPLLRFIDKEKGPVLWICSAPAPNYFKRWFWYSTGKLHPEWGCPGSAYEFFLNGGGGWSRSKEESQRKAVTEAVERWAIKVLMRNSPGAAGLRKDPSSNGFAALPAEFANNDLIMNSYSEAIERWALERTCGAGDIPLQRVIPKDDRLIRIFNKHCFSPLFFQAGFIADKIHALGIKEVRFCLCLLKTQGGGIIPGSACGLDEDSCFRRAALEAYAHAETLKKMIKRGSAPTNHLLEKRLWHFGTSQTGWRDFERRLNQIDRLVFYKTPDLYFHGAVEGPWNPEIAVYRVLLEGCSHFYEGGVSRFMI
jgi:hypothetical protein